MLGAPGSGKGTYAKEIARALLPTTTNSSTLPILSTGDILREEILKNTNLGVQAKLATEGGMLVPDELVTSIVFSRLHQFQTTGYILDGYPRTLAQAESLATFPSIPSSDSDNNVDDDGVLQSLTPTTVINLSLATDVIVEKLMGRRVCTECGTSYNVASVVDLERGYDMPAMLPPKECEDMLVSRKDDTVDVIEGECCCCCAKKNEKKKGEILLGGFVFFSWFFFFSFLFLCLMADSDFLFACCAGCCFIFCFSTFFCLKIFSFTLNTERLRVYNRETAPLIEWYEKQGLLIHVEIKKGMLEVPRIIQKIQKHLKANEIANEWSRT